jgi:(p)ppGpp synthase/HD superfamily hydrolase
VNEVEALARAYNFAATRHSGQFRKGEAGEPYVNHLAEVAQLVAQATAGGDVDLVIAAVLHDTVEDTRTTFDEIEAAFGPRVASLVGEVTDDKSLEKAERKRLQIEHAGHASTGAKIIKIADKTSNLRALASSPPVGWAAQRRAEYLDWAVQVVDRCRGVNAWLEGEFDAAAGALGAMLLLPPLPAEDRDGGSCSAEQSGPAEI